MGWTPPDPTDLLGHKNAGVLAASGEQHQLTINLLPKAGVDFKLNVKCCRCGYSECLPSDHFCSMCGKLLVKEMICENCGAVLNRPEQNFCHFCGKSAAN